MGAKRVCSQACFVEPVSCPNLVCERCCQACPLLMVQFGLAVQQLPGNVVGDLIKTAAKFASSQAFVLATVGEPNLLGQHPRRMFGKLKLMAFVSNPNKRGWPRPTKPPDTKVPSSNWASDNTPLSRCEWQPSLPQFTKPRQGKVPGTMCR